MSVAETCTILAEIGEKAANQQVRDEHFPGAFNLQS